MSGERIGVTGHRWNRLSREKASDLERALGALFHAMAIDAYSQHTLVCGMAEGTDMVAAACRPTNWALEAALPLPHTSWSHHLAAQPGVTGSDLAEFERLMEGASVVTFDSRAPEPDYLALAQHIATTCTRVVAVWDGRPGKPGGTADVVARARANGADVHILEARPFLIA